MSAIPREFYARPALEVARDLLGCRLVRLQEGQRLAGVITETEAYQGENDLGCHAAAGKTPRNAVMYGPPGHAYVYFTYGMHWLLNAVTDLPDTPSAVLIRAIHPTEGCQQMEANRPHLALKPGWTDGPAKLTQALAIKREFNQADLCNQKSGLWIEFAKGVQDADVERGPRVGLNSVPEPWRSIPWWFKVSPGNLNN